MPERLLIKFENYAATEITDLRTKEKWKLVSKCNRCGKCCTIPEFIHPCFEDFWDYRKRSCRFLEVWPGKAIGEPGATRCRLHQADFDKPWGCVLGFYRGVPEQVRDVCTLRYKKVR